MSSAVADFDRWIRNDFAHLNTELEEAYFAARTQILLDCAELDGIKQRLMREGAELARRITDSRAMPQDPHMRYELLGSVGYYLGACRRHEIDGAQAAAWPLARLLGSSLGVAPRFVFAHQAFYNRAVRDRFRTFTSLEDERTFITYNALAALAYQRTATSLGRISQLGVSSPLAAYLLQDALTGLDEVLHFSKVLSKQLDTERFFFNIRPYFKPYRVGGVEYRGANAGDFAAINSIDVLLGLCSPYDPFYQAVLAEKYPYMPPEEQALLRTTTATEPLLDAFIRESADGPLTPQLRDNADLFLSVCRRFGAAYAFHHHQLVGPFLKEPATYAPPEQQSDLTASGPPLDVVIENLSRLSDLRAARPRPGATSARASLDKLRELLDATA
ncbi:monodechloroaminopyrrolnitrin synthase PrnB family protein [Streptomyces sp. NPDC093600]|uniref:monodechloroaminopyrrolnitrin synthase PrnB family protein n=1 Tax=Streptomyces sp. NPDC093600 TaxID=3366047 RepID=UPI00381409FB